MPTAILQRAFDLAVLATSAQLLGLGEHLLDASVAYVKQRKQFGREIGSYQAIKHRLADVRIALDFARPLVFGAALDEVPASAAKVATGDAAYLAARAALQVHGAVGYTRELDLSLWILKVRALVTRVGNPGIPPGPRPGGDPLMELALTEEQQELASTLRSLLAKQADSAAVRAAMESEKGYDEALWTTLVEQVGVAALPVPEEHDGVGASLMETAVALEEIGRSLAPSPLLASAIASAALLLHGTDEQRAELLPRIAAGETATVVLEPPMVLEPAAAIVLIPRGDALGCRTPAPNLDRHSTRPCGSATSTSTRSPRSRCSTSPQRWRPRSRSGPRSAGWTCRSPTRRSACSSAGRSGRSRR